MAKRKGDWRQKWSNEGFGLGPHAYGDQVEQHLRGEIPFDTFARKMNVDLTALELSLPRTTVEWLYTIGLQARTEREVTQFAKRIVQKREWKTKSQKLTNLGILLHTLPDYDLEAGLRNSLGNKDRPKLTVVAAQLERILRKLLRVYASWREFATWGTLRPDYKSRIVFVERYLKKHHSNVLKTQQQRVVVILNMLDAIGLNRNADERSISRMLSRVKKSNLPTS
jgi:hypothetical protein